MTAALVQEQFESLETRADALGGRMRRNREESHQIARETFVLYEEFTAQRGRGFYAWFTVRTRRSTGTATWFVKIGAALAQGLTAETDVELHDAGKSLLDQGVPPQQVRAELAAGTIRDMTRLRAGQGTTPLPVPTGEVASVREAVESARETAPGERLSDPEATARLARGWNALPESTKKTALKASDSGETMEDAARKVLAEYLDHRAWLAQQPCSVPGCGEASAELHHLKLNGQRFRSNELLLPLCRRHHQAQPGLESEAAHAAHQAEWATRFWGSESAFWQFVASLYGEFLRERA